MFGSSIGEKMQTLRTKGGRLKCRAEDIISELKAAEFRLQKKRKREVENWLENVEKKTKELQNLEQEVKQSGTLPGFLVFGLGKRAENMIKEMNELVEQGKFSGGLFLDVNESKGEPFLTTKLMGEAFQNNLQTILEFLKKDDVLKIGIYGMGGVGKTTLATHIHNLLLEESNNIFHHVYWVTVSHDFSIHKLQDMIAKTVLKRDLTNEHDERKRAAELSRVLLQRDKCLLILDDVWNHFHLEDVGICLKVNGCKLILTTRFFDVCCRMACDEKIKVESLPGKETWDLFKETLGHGLALSPDIEKFALSIAKRCAGLPLGIITMAGSMRGVNDIHEWRNVLEELENPTAGQRDMQDEVFPLLKLSYDRLKDAKLQHCFLYCALYPEDEEIERKELITFFIVEGIIDRNKSMQAKFDMGHTLLNKLENACLLESCRNRGGERYVKMHDLTREMALQITKVSPRFMVKSERQFCKIPDEKEWMEDLEKVSLRRTNIKEIPEGTSPRCPKLSTLLFDGNNLNKIPCSFFVHMRALSVLDLSDNKIYVLPDSISDLESLTALILENCNQLLYVPPLGNLRALQLLDLSGTNIKEVPQGMEMLFNLNCLYMEGMRNKVTFPTGILHRLSHLQVLRLDQSRILGVQSGEMEELTLLEEIRCPMYDIRDFKQFVKSQCFMRLSLCDIGIRDHGDGWHVRCLEYTTTKKDRLVRITNISFKGDGGEVDAALLPRDIQICEISFCNGIEYIARFPFSNNTFSNLKVLEINNCHKIKKLFQPGLLHYLQNLEHILAETCSEMEEIIAEDDEGMGACSSNATIFRLPKLKTFKLIEIPSLKSICKGVMACDSIETITIVGCGQLKRVQFSLPLTNGQSFPPHALQLIEIGDNEKEWWESLEWDHPNDKNVLQPFVKLIDVIAIIRYRRSRIRRRDDRYARASVKSHITYL